MKVETVLFCDRKPGFNGKAKLKSFFCFSLVETLEELPSNPYGSSRGVVEVRRNFFWKSYSL